MWIEEKKNVIRAVERYVDPMTGKAKRVYTTMEKNTSAQRKIAAKQLNAIINERLNPSIGDYTLKYISDHYLLAKKKDWKQSTFSREVMAQKSILELLGEDSIINNMTIAFVNARFSSSSHNNTSLNEWIKRFKTMIRWAYRNELIDSAKLADKITYHKTQTTRQRVRDKYLETFELQFLIGKMNHETWSLLTLFLVYSGLRIGEAMALKPEDIDLKGRKIIVEKTYDTINNVITSTKTEASCREVYIQDELYDICVDINKAMRRMDPSNRFGRKYFFCIEGGGMICYRAYCKYIRDYSIKHLKEKIITPHTLRHTHTSLMSEKGVSLDTISRRLGHANSRVTKEIYLHVTKSVIKDDNRQIDNAKLNIKRRLDDVFIS